MLPASTESSPTVVFLATCFAGFAATNADSIAYEMEQQPESAETSAATLATAVDEDPQSWIESSLDWMDIASEVTAGSRPMTPWEARVTEDFIDSLFE